MSTHRSNQKSNRNKPHRRILSWQVLAPYILATGVIATFVGLFTVFTLMQRPAEPDAYDQIYASPQRDLAQIPFDLTDATYFCQQKTRKRYGDNLAMSYVDNHSTRLDKRTGLYKVFIVAHVGTMNDYTETGVHCFVDEYRHNLAHYRTFESKDSFIGRALQFFN